LIAVLISAFLHYPEMNLLIAIIFLYSIPNIRSHGLAFSESDILNIVKNLEETIESQGKRIRLLEENCNNKEYGFAARMDTKSKESEECPCDEIKTDIEFLMIENNRQQEEIERHDTRLDTVENDVADHTIRLNTVENDLNTVENDVADHDTRLDTIENPVWFDAYRTNYFSTTNEWKTLTYTDARRATSYPNAMDINTGVFTAPETGTYQFIIQAAKQNAGGQYGNVMIVHEGTSISYIFDSDTSHSATITGTAIIPMELGQRVWVETQYDLYSSSSVWIHFTGVLLTPK